MTRDFPPALFEAVEVLRRYEMKKKGGVREAHEDLVESTAALHLRARSAMARTVPMTMTVVCSGTQGVSLGWGGLCE